MTATYQRLLLGGALDMDSGQFWIDLKTENSTSRSHTICWIVSYGACDASLLVKREERCDLIEHPREYLSLHPCYQK